MSVFNAAIYDATTCRRTRFESQCLCMGHWIRRAFLCGALIFCGFGVLTLPHNVLAQSGVAETTVQSYRIAPGSLIESLNQFSAQSGIKLSFDATALEALRAYGLEGPFAAQSGLDFLLIGSGLQAVEQADGFKIQKVPAATSEVITVLPSIEVAATNVSRYVATTSVTATKTDTLLRDVPQSISVITNEVIKDQRYKVWAMPCVMCRVLVYRKVKVIVMH